MTSRLRRIGPGFNWRLIVPVVSGALGAVGVGMGLCAAYAATLGDGRALEAFLIPAAVLLPLAGLGLAASRRLRSLPLRARDGFLAVTLAWLLAAMAGAAPFVIDGVFPRYVDALFESMSGFSTTGATLLHDIEAQPDAILLWRSLSQWIGGIGIVVLVVAIAPATGLATQRVFYAETSGVTAERLTPRIADTAKIIAGIYLVLTVLGAIAFLIAGLGPFDAVNHVLASLSTGGFSTRTASLGAFDSVAVESVAMGLMILGGINFAFYWLALRGGPMWPQAAEVRAFIGILVVSTALVGLSLILNEHPGGSWENIRDAAFTVTSVSTGTGLTTADFDLWNDYARAHLLLIMFIGACAGSTSGGLKVIRVMLLAKSVTQELQRQLRPRAVLVLRTRGRVFSEDIRRGVLGFILVYMLVALAGTLAMLATGLDLVSAATGAGTTLTLLGPGMGELGTSENFSVVSEPGRVVLTFLMLAGRLEVFTVLVLLTPAFYRRNVA